MSSKVVLGLILAMGLLAISVADDVDESDVVVLTAGDFESKAAGYKVILVFFSAPWCGYCKRLRPEYARAATILKNSNPSVPLAKVNCDTHKQACLRYGVTNYPKLKLFRYGVMIQDYSGTRDVNGIVNLMTLKAGPSSTVLSSEADLNSFLRSNEHNIVGFFTSNVSAMASHFKDLSDYLVERHRFAITTDPALRSKYGPGEVIVMFRPERLASAYEPSEIKLTTDETLNGLLSWVAENMHGMCGLRTPSNTDEFFKRPITVVYYDINFEQDRASTVEWHNRVLEASRELNRVGTKVYFAISNAKDFRMELESFGLQAPAAGQLAVAARDVEDSKFATTGLQSTDDLVNFVNNFLGGKLLSYTMSEPVPDNAYDDLVKVLVGSTFKDVVFNPDKDVVIELYVPWCGNCRRLAPIYYQLAEAMANEPDLIIAKMNSATNDSPVHYRASKYPTIYFAPKGSKAAPRIYDGPRSLDILVQFVAREATSELAGFTRDGTAKSTHRDL